MEILDTKTLVKFDGSRYIRIKNFADSKISWRKVVDNTTVEIPENSELENEFQKLTAKTTLYYTVDSPQGHVSDNYDCSVYKIVDNALEHLLDISGYGDFELNIKESLALKGYDSNNIELKQL